jgi:hypothetical protein
VPHWLDSLSHSLHWGDVPAYLGAVVSALFGFLSWRSSRRSKAAEREAKQHADDALAAQKQTAEETKRLATAQERQTRLAELEAEAAERAPWRIEHRRDIPHRVNKTFTPKYGVSVDGAVRPGPGNSWDVIQGGGSQALDVLPPLAQMTNRPIIVQWHLKEDRSDQVLVWHDVLPD